MDKENILVWRYCRTAGESSGLVEEVAGKFTWNAGGCGSEHQGGWGNALYAEFFSASTRSPVQILSTP